MSALSETEGLFISVGTEIEVKSGRETKGQPTLFRERIRGSFNHALRAWSTHSGSEGQVNYLRD